MPLLAVLAPLAVLGLPLGGPLQLDDVPACPTTDEPIKVICADEAVTTYPSIPGWQFTALKLGPKESVPSWADYTRPSIGIDGQNLLRWIEVRPAERNCLQVISRSMTAGWGKPVKVFDDPSSGGHLRTWRKQGHEAEFIVHPGGCVIRFRSPEEVKARADELAKREADKRARPVAP